MQHKRTIYEAIQLYNIWCRVNANNITNKASRRYSCIKRARTTSDKVARLQTIQLHFETSKNAKSQGNIEQFHSTLTEYLKCVRDRDDGKFISSTASVGNILL